MSEETPDQPSDQPEIFSPVQPSGSDIPFLSEESVSQPSEPGFAAPGAPSASPVAPSYIDVSKRRSLFELWGATFQTIKGNFSPIVQMSALLSLVSTALQMAMLVAVFVQIPDAAKYIKDVQSGEFTVLTTGQLDGADPLTLSNNQIIGIVAAVGITVVALLLMTFVTSGIFYVFVAPRAEGSAPLTFAEVRKAFFQSLPRMLSATVMWAARAMGIIAVISALLAATYFLPGDLTWLAIIIILIGGPFLIWYAISTTLTAYVVQSTNLSGNKSVSRSIQLVRGAWWRTVWVLLATNLIAGMFASAISGLVPMPGSVLDSTATIAWGYIALFSASNFITALISVPLSSITIAHYYRDRSGS